VGKLVLAIRDGLVQLFGIGSALVAIGLAVTVWLLLRGRWSNSSIFWRLWLGASLAIVVALGLLSLWQPSWTIGDVSLAEATAGGEAGRLLTISSTGVLAMVAAALLSASLFWPPFIPTAAYISYRGLAGLVEGGRLVS